MKDLRSPWLPFVLVFALSNFLGCEALQGRQAPGSTNSPLSVNSSSLDFGTVVVGSSGILSMTVTNRGTVTSTIPQATVSNPEFAVMSPSFPLALAPGSGARIFVRFTPQSAGSPSGVIAIGGNSRHSTTVTVKGAAILPGKFSAVPADVRFGKVPKGKTQTRTETFTNTGSTNITISQASVSNSAFQLTGPALPLVLAPAQSAVFNVAFTPQTVGRQGGSLSVTSSASLVASNRASVTSRIRRHGSSETNSIVPLDGMGVGQGQLAASPLALSFGSAQLGRSVTKAVTLTNSGTSAMQITQATVAGAGFSLGPMNVPVTLQAGQSANVSVVFSPPAAGNQNGSLTVVSDGVSPVTLISLSGSSPVAASGTLSANLAALGFGSVQVGNTKTQSGILTNSGNAQVIISQANISGSSFSGSGLVLPMKLSAGQSTAFTVTYAPTAIGTSSGNLTFVSDATNASLGVSLAGTATAAPTPGVLTSSLSGLNFGTVEVGKTKTQAEILTNSGATAITVSQANLSGVGFSLSGLTLPVKLNPGQSASFSVAYSPLAAGNSSGTINLLSDASNPTVAVSLSGAATATPSPAVLAQSLTSLVFGNVQVGTTKTEAESLTNTGGSAITLSQVSVSGSGFSVSGLSLPVKLTSGQSANFTVTYAPTTPGIGSGSLVIVSDASNATLAASLSGTAIAAPEPGVLAANANSLSFGSVQVGNTKTQTETLKNTGGSTVTISQASLSGVGFSLDGLYLPLQLNAGESFTFSVVFAPGAAAPAAGSLTLVSDASNSVPTISLAGSGAAAGQLNISPASLGFGNVTVGSGKSLTTTLTALNSGLMISSAQLSDPEFSFTGASFPLSLSAGQSVVLTLTFTPQSTGSASGSLAFATNAPTPTVTQHLAGAGVAAAQHSVTLNWNPNNSAAGYLVYRATKSGGPYARLTASSTPMTSYDDTSVQSGGTYFYVTTSVDGNGAESDDSNEVRVSIPTP